MSIEAIREFITELWIKYQSVKTRLEKSIILDSICVTLDVHRKAAVRLMKKTKMPSLRLRSGSAKEKYSKESKTWFVYFWNQMGRMNARKMRAALPEWLPLHQDLKVTKPVVNELLMMSTSTMDRILAPVRAQIKRTSNTGTGKSQFLTLIPLRNLGEKISEVGHIEVDLVAHCGGSLSGTHAWTVTMTDVFSGWTCARAVLGKCAIGVVAEMQQMVSDFPFPIKAFYFDNGTEFINCTMVEAFKAKCELFRSRPYKKNDQAHVEQKNQVFVRELFGYTRVDQQNVVTQMNKIYSQYWQALQNYYVPSAKTESKVRIGSKIKRRMSNPETSFDRIMRDPTIAECVKGQLQEAKRTTNPWALRTEIKKRMRTLWRYFLSVTKWTQEEIVNAK